MALAKELGFDLSGEDLHMHHQGVELSDDDDLDVIAGGVGKPCRNKTVGRSVFCTM